ncbi:MAG: nicotinate-nucleotide adenylyltransferase [Lachnospiraceae bacterium]|nr:nicotinate-nucleotide adenylyltransferase [Lachnospiraceae bacterium]
MSTENRKKIGIMGGTFDPIHFGHLIIAENAREQFALDQVLFIPTGHSPHKQDQYITTAVHRCRMVSLAIYDHPQFVLNKIEIESPEISYTYLTLQKLKEEYINAELYFILGADSLFDFELWKEPELILENANILAAYRGYKHQKNFSVQLDHLNQKYPEKFFPLCTPNFEVSSHNIRDRVCRRQTIRYLVPKEVEDYIREYHLYEGEVSL